MLLWLVLPARADEPIVVLDPARAGAPALARREGVLPWDTVGFVKAAPERPAIGPDLLAVGPDGRVALYDPVGRRVIAVGGASFPVAAADDLAFTAAGVLLVMDDTARTLRTYAEDGDLLGEHAFPALVPPGGSLGLDGDTVCSVDVFHACHPLATVSPAGRLDATSGAPLRSPARVVQRDGDTLRVDGRAVATVNGRGGGRLLGEWLLVEVMDEGAVTRQAIPLAGGAAVVLPVDGRLYAPSRDVAAGPDGTLGWLDPRADGLHVVTVGP